MQILTAKLNRMKTTKLREETISIYGILPWPLKHHFSDGLLHAGFVEFLLHSFFSKQFASKNFRCKHCLHPNFNFLFQELKSEHYPYENVTINFQRLR